MLTNGELFKENQEKIYMTLPELDVSVGKFSNVTLGKDEVDYILINTKNISESGTIAIPNLKQEIKHIGSKSGIAKYAVKKGDVIFSFRGRAKAMAVVTEESAIPMVGHHGLMKISCGEENLDLAFFIRDFLQKSGILKHPAKSDISIEFLNNIGFPIASKEIHGYADAVSSFKSLETACTLFGHSLKSVGNEIYTNAIQEDHQANIALSDVEMKFSKKLQNMKDEYINEIKIIKSKYKNI